MQQHGSKYFAHRQTSTREVGSKGKSFFLKEIMVHIKFKGTAHGAQ